MAPAAEEGGGAALGVEDMPDDMQVGLVGRVADSSKRDRSCWFVNRPVSFGA